MRRLLSTLICSTLVMGFSAFAQEESGTMDQSQASSGDQTMSTDQAGISSDNQGVANNDNSGLSNDQQPGIVSEDQNVGNSNLSQQNQPGTSGDMTGTSVATEQPQKPRGLRDEVVGIKPQVGDINFRDASGAISNRALYGFTLEANAGDILNRLTGLGGPNTGLYLGPQTGFYFSHLGAVGGNFFGSTTPGETGASNPGYPGGNMFLIPADLKAGWSVGNFRLSAHGGGNVIYRSNATAAAVGVNSPATTGSKWGILPNAGADLEYGVVNGASIVLRPDWTFGGSNRLFAATIGVGIPLG